MTDTLGLLGRQHQDVLAQLAETEVTMRTQPRAGLGAFARYLLGEVTEHFTIEEDALFPILGQHLPLEQGPLAVMNAEHAAFRELLAGLTSAVESADLDAQRHHAVELIELLRGHIAKEDGVLFPMAARLLSSDELGEVDRCAAALAQTAPSPDR